MKGEVRIIAFFSLSPPGTVSPLPFLRLLVRTFLPSPFTSFFLFLLLLLLSLLLLAPFAEREIEGQDQRKKGRGRGRGRRTFGLPKKGIYSTQTHTHTQPTAQKKDAEFAGQITINSWPSLARLRFPATIIDIDFFRPQSAKLWPGNRSWNSLAYRRRPSPRPRFPSRLFFAHPSSLSRKEKMQARIKKKEKRKGGREPVKNPSFGQRRRRRMRK